MVGLNTAETLFSGFIFPLLLFYPYIKDNVRFKCGRGVLPLSVFHFYLLSLDLFASICFGFDFLV